MGNTRQQFSVRTERWEDPEAHSANSLSLLTDYFEPELARVAACFSILEYLGPVSKVNKHPLLNPQTVSTPASSTPLSEAIKPEALPFPALKNSDHSKQAHLLEEENSDRVCINSPRAKNQLKGRSYFKSLPLHLQSNLSTTSLLRGTYVEV